MALCCFTLRAPGFAALLPGRLKIVGGNYEVRKHSDLLSLTMLSTLASPSTACRFQVGVAWSGSSVAVTHEYLGSFMHRAFKVSGKATPFAAVSAG